MTYSYFFKPVFIFSIILLPFLSNSQTGSSYIEKLSPTLRASVLKQPTTKPDVYVVYAPDTSAFKDFLGKSLSVFPVSRYREASIFLVRTSFSVLLDSVLTRPEVRFADILRIPKEELAVSNLDISVNRANLLHARFPQYNGNNVTVSVKENRPDTSDIDLKGRYIQTPFTSPAYSGHATIMATIIAGAGNTYYEGKGVAPGARITSADFVTLLPEPDAAYQQYDITVQNHSYGTGIENYYGADAAAYDASVINNPGLLHVFSAGNAGTQASTTGPYSGITSFANLTERFQDPNHYEALSRY